MRALAFVTLLSTVALGCDENILDPMADRQPRAHAYKESVFFSDGLSMHASPEGTVPRGRITHNPALTLGRTADTGPVQLDGDRTANYVAAIPVTLTPQLLALGRKRFDILCATCHGPAGDGDSIVARQMALRPPPTLHKYRDRPAGYFYEVITKGFGLMASYAAELSIEERWAVVAYIRALQLSQNVRVDRIPADERTRLLAEPSSGTPAPLPGTVAPPAGAHAPSSGAAPATPPAAPVPPVHKETR
ncbi:MAG TPA: cytochrome c [Polyangia bacterium]|jgi:mono/diheme cytochrome c family protein|nr:cytochrome c [Polyangia bacterium]